MLPWRQTTTRSENSASQQIDQGLLTFAKSFTFHIRLCGWLSRARSACWWGSLTCSACSRSDICAEFPHSFSLISLECLFGKLTDSQLNAKEVGCQLRNQCIAIGPQAHRLVRWNETGSIENWNRWFTGCGCGGKRNMNINHDRVPQ